MRPPTALSKLLGNKVDKPTPGDTADPKKKKKPKKKFSQIPGLSKLIGY